MLAALMKKEVLALVRDAHGLAALFLMPAMFIVVMSLALQDVYAPPLRVLRYAVDAHDRGPLAGALLAQWARRHGPAEPLAADWRARLTAGRLDYVIVTRPGLSDELASPGLPTQARLQLLAEPGIDPNTLSSLRAEWSGAAGELKAREALAGAGGPGPAPGASMLALVQAERFAGSGPRPSSVQHNVPAWLVFGMFFVVASLSSLLVAERSSGALARLQSLGVPHPVMLMSKALPYLAVNGLQAALMLAVGVWAIPLLGGQPLSLAGIHWPALVVALGAISLAAVGMALALACAVRTHAQATAIGPIVNVLMAAVGGVMVPQSVMPASMQRLAGWSPMNWGLQALLDVLLRGGDVASTLPEVGRLLAFAALMAAVALLAFRRLSR